MQKVYYPLLLGAYLLINISKCEESNSNDQSKNEDNSEIKKDLNRSNDIVNPWEEYMMKYDIENNHNSGIKVDLGEDVKVKNSTVRIPAGKCPVFGKGITIIDSNVNFLKAVATGNQALKTGGFALPKTNIDISPKTISAILEKYKDSDVLKNLNDVSVCHKYASSFIPANSNKNTEYRHPSVFDSSNKTCYILYIAAQENSGPRYCDDSESNANRLFCFKPEKKEEFKNYVYLNKNVYDDWQTKCPYKNVIKAKFGLWVDGICEDIFHTVKHNANDLLECNNLVFQNSASDQPTQYEVERTDYKMITDAIEKNKPEDLHNAFFPPGAFNADNKKSKVKGFNWGNYDQVKKKCYAFDVKPTCLINNEDFI
ncbi:apical membrane antigen 1, partial [Hepatocystis sp. ex Piliocolobus tephrosceles]